MPSSIHLQQTNSQYRLAVLQLIFPVSYSYYGTRFRQDSPSLRQISQEKLICIYVQSGKMKVQLYTRRKSLARCSRDIKSITSL